ncbi:MAG TPA: UDP-N-acetylmuramoyl-L-alanyl-D-glutamate--2,6-diaminopimelate ligase [Burkholderiales bacterium]|nr:UDP-N-acetylmuramoyl-L-alanyl-D-glutamate--2,6-diaminopimelate ligase [Burkholderiales bacterium]
MEPFAELAAQGAMIERLTSDSRRCTPGTAFFAYPGEKADGRAHIADALARGASAVLWESADRFPWRDEWRVANVGVEALKSRAGELAAAFYGRPSERLWTCGITGTNGKTSCSQWLAALLEMTGTRAGVIGTLGSGYPGQLAGAGNTTPDALELQERLARFAHEGAGAVSMEVSSHGLVQGRVNGVRFACALFTNLSHDHLDYHGSMQAYAEAKTRLFDMPGLQAAVLNMDDALGRELAQRMRARGVRTIGYATHGPARAAGEFLHARGDAIDSSWGSAPLRVNAVGHFNVANALGVLGCLLAKGLAFDEALPLLERLPGVPGRMQKVSERPLVVIDYAHTPDALEKVLGALRPVAAARRGRLVAVFGAGGDRDPSKRPLMGEVAGRLADRVVLTSDNPRGEEPQAIIAAIAAGMKGGHEVEPDRARAIGAAIQAAADEDVVLLAGKGHETYQEARGTRLPFSDAAVARGALASRSRA